MKKMNFKMTVITPLIFRIAITNEYANDGNAHNANPRIIRCRQSLFSGED